MTTKKIIPCLDVKDGKVVKGVNFEGMREMGDPVDMAKAYSENGADELVFLDISATTEGRDTMVDVVKKVAEKVSVPFTVGGGIKTLEDISRVLEAGADKVGINSAAVVRPELIAEAAEKFGSERIVAAVDAKLFPDGTWRVMTRGGLHDSGLDAIEWSKKLEELGAGAILPTSVDRDGVKDGYDLKLTKAIVDAVSIPVIASGGCGNAEHIVEVFKETNAAAALAASIFHEDIVSVGEVKALCRERGVEVSED
ncbi:imidazole glycerol phosphate synthase subunit HisF [Lederbergia citrea]|uniref:Imidazole glycerol phosphate synthase subunit HisF n=1 Tax=Lederbergia citrea TaxID=2833581 RepID=A0A942UVC0_9BACI|nr:imidazole glycerol phosphate synthase subunit HisF [Lederbergia citrea]MBS4205967.1 imidazole glycerol phosphate synthase subunit HisF [Lederbergia citrea]MBS4224584.1 imidazole glycerol phosphate synthase subunit HisF [Lederbergia citrea]